MLLTYHSNKNKSNPTHPHKSLRLIQINKLSISNIKIECRDLIMNFGKRVKK